MDWHFKKLKEIAVIKGRIGWKGLKRSEFSKQGVLIINGPNIIDGRVDWQNCLRIPFWRYQESMEISVKVSDILVTKDGTIGKTAYIKSLREPATLASGIFLIRSQETQILIQDFLYQYFKSPLFRKFVVSRTEGSVIPHLYQRDIEDLVVPVPPLLEQKAIAKILSDIDSKIELNTQMNRTLEAIAQTIFKRWFIDFEFPNGEGKPYKSSGGEMVDSERGEIPRRWSIKSIDTVAEFLNGLPLQKYAISEGEDYLPIIKIRELNNGISESTDKASVNIPKNYIVEDGDVLFSWSGTLGIVLWGHGKGALNQHLFKVTSKAYPKWFYYYWLRHYLSSYIDIAKDKATTMGHIQRHHLSESSVAVPDSETLEYMVLQRILWHGYNSSGCHSSLIMTEIKL